VRPIPSASMCSPTPRGWSVAPRPRPASIPARATRRGVTARARSETTSPLLNLLPCSHRGYPPGLSSEAPPERTPRRHLQGPEACHMLILAANFSSEGGTDMCSVPMARSVTPSVLGRFWTSGGEISHVKGWNLGSINKPGWVQPVGLQERICLRATPMSPGFLALHLGPSHPQRARGLAFENHPRYRSTASIGTRAAIALVCSFDV
jgi:hypothetical protein